MSKHKEAKEIEELFKAVDELRRRVSRLEHLHFLPDRSTLTILDSKGAPIMPLTVNQTDAPGVAHFQEFQAGVAGGPVGTVTFSSDTPTVATVDPVSGQLAYLPNTTGVASATATISAVDSGAPQLPPASDVLTVTYAAPPPPPFVPDSSTLTLVPGGAVAAIKKL